MVNDPQLAAGAQAATLLRKRLWLAKRNIKVMRAFETTAGAWRPQAPARLGPALHGMPFLALGMSTAPFNWAKRQQVRSTMLRAVPVVNGQVVFRFVVGRQLTPVEDDPSKSSSWQAHVARLQ